MRVVGPMCVALAAAIACSERVSEEGLPAQQLPTATVAASASVELASSHAFALGTQYAFLAVLPADDPAKAEEVKSTRACINANAKYLGIEEPPALSEAAIPQFEEVSTRIARAQGMAASKAYDLGVESTKGVFLAALADRVQLATFIVKLEERFQSSTLAEPVWKDHWARIKKEQTPESFGALAIALRVAYGGPETNDTLAVCGKR